MLKPDNPPWRESNPVRNLEFGIWILFVICDLVLGIFSMIGTTVYLVSVDKFLFRFTTDTKHAPIHKPIIPLKPMGGKIGVGFDLSESGRLK
jgi:hypothetical protein